MVTRTENLPRSKNAPQERFCPPERAAGTSCSIPVRRPKPYGKKLLPLTRTGNLPRANEQSAGLFVAHCGAPPCTGRGCPASGCAPWAGLAFCDPRPCSGSLHPPQAAVACAAILVRRPKPYGKKLLPLTRTGNLPRANEQSAGLFVAHCGAPPCSIPRTETKKSPSA